MNQNELKSICRATFLERMDTYSMTKPTLDQETLSTCVRQLEDVFGELPTR